MSKLVILLCLLSTVTYVLTFEEFMSEEAKKNAKMILCGTCKDAGVTGDLNKFRDCVAGHYPAEIAKMIGIREAHMSNPDECINLMKAEFEGYARADPSGIIKVMDCFKANVVHEHLAKCH